METQKKPSLTPDHVHRALWEIVAKQMDVKPESLKPGMRLHQELGADSLEIVELGMTIDDQLGVTLPDELLGNPDLTLADVEKAILAQL